MSGISSTPQKELQKVVPFIAAPEFCPSHVECAPQPDSQFPLPLRFVSAAVNSWVMFGAQLMHAVLLSSHLYLLLSAVSPAPQVTSLTLSQYWPFSPAPHTAASVPQVSIPALSASEPKLVQQVVPPAAPQIPSAVLSKVSFAHIEPVAHVPHVKTLFPFTKVPVLL